MNGMACRWWGGEMTNNWVGLGRWILVDCRDEQGI